MSIGTRARINRHEPTMIISRVLEMVRKIPEVISRVLEMVRKLLEVISRVLE